MPKPSSPGRRMDPSLRWGDEWRKRGLSPFRKSPLGGDRSLALRVGTEAVGPGIPFLDIIDEQQEDSDQRHQRPQDCPARTVGIVQPPNRHRDPGNEGGEAVQAGEVEDWHQIDVHLGLAHVGIIADQEGQPDERADQHVEQHEHPIFAAPRAAGKVGVAAQRHKHPAHDRPSPLEAGELSFRFRKEAS